MNTPGVDVEPRPPLSLRGFPARSIAQYRALHHAAVPRRLLQHREPVLRLARQSGKHSAAGLGHRDHRRRPDLRHPDRRDRSQRRRGRQRDRDRADVLHAAAGLREHRQPADAGGDRHRPGARRLLRAWPHHRLRRHPHRHPVVHHDPGDDADRRRRLGGAGARADRLFRAEPRFRRSAPNRSAASPGSSSSRRSSCWSPISC